MVETFATSSYKEKFFGNLTLKQSAIMLALLVPGVLLVIRGYSPVYVIPYGLFCIGVYAAVAYFGLDDLVASWLRFNSSGKRLLWKTKRMMEFIGVEDIDSDTVHTRDRRLLSVITVMPKDLGSLSESDVEKVLAGYGTFLHEMSTNVQIIMSSTEIDLEGYLQKLKEKVLLSGSQSRSDYFGHFAQFTRGVVKSKTVTDRDYYLVITQPMSEDVRRSLCDLEAKTKNLMASLRDAGIDCERLTTERLIGFLANFYNPRLRLPTGDWTPITFHDNMVAHEEAQGYVRRFKDALDPSSPLGLPRSILFERGGLDYVRNAVDREAFIIEQLMPSSVDFHKTYADVEKLHRVLFTVRFPAVVHPGWLTKLIRQPIDFDIVFHIHPLSQKTSIDYLQHEITKLETDVTAKEREGLLVAERDRVNLQKVKELLNRVSRDEEKCFDVALYVNVKAYSLKDLDLAVMRIRDVLEGMNAQVRVANWEMEDALISCYPLAHDKLGERRDRMFPSSAVRDSYPFILSSLGEAGDSSIIVGYNQLNGIPVLLDVFTQPNPHVLVLGSSGSGKSFMVKKILLAEAMQDVDLFIIDPQGEYGKIVESMGGEVIRLAPGSSSTINLFDLSNDTYDGRKGSIKAFFNIVRGTMDCKLSGESVGIIDRMVDNAFRKVGIYPDDPTTWNKTPPTFHDIYEALNQYTSESNNRVESWKRATAEALLTYITPFVSGDMRYLSRQSSLNLRGKNIVCFDTSSSSAFKPIERSLVLFIVFDYIHSWCERAGRQRRKMILLDEAWSVFENNQDYLGPIVRTGRKDNVSVVIIDQNVEDLLAPDAAGMPRGHVLLNNTSTKFLLRQESACLKLVSEKFALTDSQRLFLQNAGTGDVLMLTPNLKIPLYVLSSEHEKRMLSSSPGDRRKTQDSGLKTFAGMRFDQYRDPVLPAGILTNGDAPRLTSEGYVEVADTGLSSTERTIYYVRKTSGEDIIHFLRKNLIFKFLEGARLSLHLTDEQMPVRMHERFMPDVTFTTAGGMRVAVELVSEGDTQEDCTFLLRKIKGFRLRDYSTIILLALDDSVKSALESAGCANVIYAHEVKQRLREIISKEASQGAG